MVEVTCRVTKSLCAVRPRITLCIYVRTVLCVYVQDEVETGREELTFKSHRINDLEQALRREKEHTTSLTAEMQVHTTYCTYLHNMVCTAVMCVCVCQGVLEKLAREVEKNTQLSSELQEGENGKQQVRDHVIMCTYVQYFVYLYKCERKALHQYSGIGSASVRGTKSGNS